MPTRGHLHASIKFHMENSFQAIRLANRMNLGTATDCLRRGPSSLEIFEDKVKRRIIALLIGLLASAIANEASAGGMMRNNYAVRTCVGWMKSMHLPPGKIRQLEYSKCLDDATTFQPDPSFLSALANARSACASDAERLCQSVMAEPRLRAECMSAHRDQLSSKCVEARSIVLTGAQNR
jgi:hypothetical protein